MSWRVCFVLRLSALLRDPAGIVKLTAGLSNIVGLSDVTGGDVTVGISGFVKFPKKEDVNPENINPVEAYER